MNQPFRVRLYQASVLAGTGAASLVALHWLLARPAVVPHQDGELSALVTTLVSAGAANPNLLDLLLGLIAATALVAAALGGLLALKVPTDAGARQLAAALSTASLSGTYLFFVTSHEVYRTAIGWTPTGSVRLALDVLAYFGYLYALVLLVRFFLSHPRLVTLDEFDRYALGRLALKRRTWHRRLRACSWIHPRLRARLHAFIRARGQLAIRHRQRPGRGLLARARSRAWIPGLLATAVLFALLDAFGARALQLATTPVLAAVIDLRDLAVPVFIAAGVTWCVYAIGASLLYQARSALPDDRKKIDWVLATIVAGGVLNFLVVDGSAWALAPMARVVFLQHGIDLPVSELRFWMVAIGFQLLALAFFVSLAMSVFYRGAIDPRLAVRRMTVFGLLGLIVAVLFVLLERMIAMQFVRLFELSANAGALVVGAVIAATISPIKTYTEKAVHTLASRFLPLDSMVGGQRRRLFIGISDLSGYTALSARDEGQAVLHAALIQRQAASLVRLHGGRIVKSMGDAVLFVFEDAGSAVAVLRGLHGGLAGAAAQLGLDPLPIHSGAHVGDVVVAHDGDIYGQAVNIVARIQLSAEPGQVVVSEAFARELPPTDCLDLGPRQFKNVPDPVGCWELVQPKSNAVPAVASAASAPLRDAIAPALG